MPSFQYRYGYALTLIVVGPLMFGAAEAQDTSLPEGAAGIAAAYPGDAGIEAHANVLFADGFEAYSSAGGLSSSGNYDVYYQQSHVTIDTSTVFSGGRSLRMTIPATGGELYNAVVKTIAPERDALYVRVYGRYQDDYSGVSYAHNGIRISGNYSGPGQRPDGTDFFLVLIENSRLGSEPEPGYTHAYVYHPEQDDAYGEHWFSDGSTSNGGQSFGESFVARPKRVPQRGQWISFEVMVQLNEPGVRDGRIAVWQDGELIADWTGLRFRDVATLKIDEIQLENGGQSSAQSNAKWYDNLVVATSYIGPMSTAGDPAPKPPTNVRIVD